MDDEGVVKVSEGNALIRTNPFQDMWALGCILYYLCSAKSLFHADRDDNLGSLEDYETLYNWDPSVKENKLSAITDKLGNIWCPFF